MPSSALQGEFVWIVSGGVDETGVITGFVASKISQDIS